MKHFVNYLIIVTLLNSTAITVMGQGNSHRKEVEAISLHSQGLIVIVPKSRTKIMAYSFLTSTWSQSDISIDASVKITPTVSKSLAACKLGQEVYAYSAKSAIWAKLKLPQDCKSNYTVGDNYVMVYVKEKKGSKLYIFGEHAKAWSGVDLTTGEMLLSPQLKKQ